ncbi:MAG: hypothetical protein A3C44_03595 [Gammaproteobacteria bacterium RIFCSPHIGHO2_02_FULL_39_13]|nr:MAG: hypothetical protein A3C44_03595 [Gammaproteobacteria bacterium RIFCSPHIGHO2_02_FULL_39_13]OGT49948.1 MAG: hypothetical protein A3E53_06205 [Gammaproteobacteria bacterium RIFCSPHIGHO2_12_FULL_39_24]
MSRCELFFLQSALDDLHELESNSAHHKRLKAVRKTLALMENNLRHPGLHTHKYTSLCGPNGEEVFEAYAENNTPSAYRIFWCYGPNKKQITIIAITPHP